ncbi:hypothetical protein ATER59S_05027 [Aquamicrobium terrae]
MSDYKPLPRQEAITITPGRGAPEGRDISMSA